MIRHASKSSLEPHLEQRFEHELEEIYSRLKLEQAPSRRRVGARAGIDHLSHTQIYGFLGFVDCNFQRKLQIAITLRTVVRFRPFLFVDIDDSYAVKIPIGDFRSRIFRKRPLSPPKPDFKPYFYLLPSRSTVQGSSLPLLLSFSLS